MRLSTQAAASASGPTVLASSCRPDAQLEDLSTPTLAQLPTTARSGPGSTDNLASVWQESGASAEFRIARIKQVATVRDPGGDYQDWRYLCEVMRNKDGSEVRAVEVRPICREGYTVHVYNGVAVACIVSSACSAGAGFEPDAWKLAGQFSWTSMHELCSSLGAPELGVHDIIMLHGEACISTGMGNCVRLWPATVRTKRVDATHPCAGL